MPAHRAPAARVAARFGIAVCAAVACLIAPPGSHAAPTLPAWTLAGARAIQIPIGFHSVAGRWSLSFDGGATFSRFNLGYDAKGRIEGSGSAGFNVFEVTGKWSVDPATGDHTVELEERAQNPRFMFEGVMEPNGGNLMGDHTVLAGFGSATAAGSGPATMIRTDPLNGPAHFTLNLDLTQLRKGRLKGRAVTDPDSGKTAPARATFDVFSDALARVERREGGRVSGKVRTRRDGTTKATVRVRGRGWSVRLVGPVDAQGFHATVKGRAKPFRFKGIEVTTTASQP